MRAKQQLVRFYLFRERKYEKAIKLCDELASTKGYKDEFKAFGLAGKFVALSLEEEYDDSAEVWNEYYPLRDSLHDDQMIKQVSDAEERNHKNLGAPIAK